MFFRSIMGATLLAAAGLGLMAGASFAESVSLSAELSGANEAPPNDSVATGSATATYDTETRMFTYAITYEGLSGAAIGAHIHGPVGAGANAGIMIPFSSADSPIEGSVKVTEAQAKDILDGMTYVNIHTQQHPGGELRGQLVQLVK